jgi:hypothetical protein
VCSYFELCLNAKLREHEASKNAGHRDTRRFGQDPPFNGSANITNSLLSDPTACTVAAPTRQTLDDVATSFTPARIESYSLTMERQILPNLTGLRQQLADCGDACTRHRQPRYHGLLHRPIPCSSQCEVCYCRPSNNRLLDESIVTAMGSRI